MMTTQQPIVTRTATQPRVVMQVVQHLRPGGIESLVLDLASFADAADTVIIISLEGTLTKAITAWPRLHSFREQLIFMDKQPGQQPALVLQLRNLFRQYNACAVHSHHIGPLIYAGLAARLAGVRYRIHTEHDAWHLQQRQRRYLQRAAIGLINPQLVADADAVANAMRTQLHYRKAITVIHNGIDTEHFIPGEQSTARRQLNLPANVVLIGCSGRLEHVKGQHLLIQALHQLPAHVHLALAGSGSRIAALRQLADQLKLSQRVHFLGHLDNMPVFYQALTVFCLPSLNEGLPLAPLEAQACNVPVLVSNVGGAAETLCPHSGRLMPANNINSMISHLTEMLAHPSYRQPRNFVIQHASIRKMTLAYAKLRNAGDSHA